MKKLEFVHGDLYSTALELSRKWVSKHSNRPTLTYTQHREGGDMVATDSHGLIKIKDIHGFKEEYLVDPKHFNFAKGNYPDTDRLMPDGDVQASFTLNKEQVRLWYQLFRSMNQTFVSMKEYSKMVVLNFKKTYVEATITSHEVVIQLPVSDYEKPELEEIAFDVELMRNAMEAHHKMKSESVDFHFTGVLRPILMDDNHSVSTMILPIRKS